MSGLRSSRNLLEAPMVIRMVLAVRKHLQITNIIMLDNFYHNFPIKSIPGEVLTWPSHRDTYPSLEGDFINIEIEAFFWNVC